MVTRIFSFIGWLGTALVLGAVAIRYFLPARDQYATYLAWAGLAAWRSTSLSQWREIGGYFRPRQARYGTLAATSVFIVLGILVATNYIGKRENKRWDLTANKQFSLSDQSRNYVAKLDAPLNIHVFAQDVGSGFRDRLKEYEYASKQVKTEYVDPDRNPARRAAVQGRAVRHDRVQVQGSNRTRDRRHGAGHHQRHHQGGLGPAEEGLLHRRPRRKGHGVSERDGYATIVQALGRENYTTEKLVLAQKGAVPTMRRSSSSPARRTTFSHRRSTRSSSTWRRTESCCCYSTRQAAWIAHRSPA